MFNMGGGEIFAILLLALLVLGPERLPKAMGQVGRYVAQLRRMSSGFQDEIRRAMDIDDMPFRPGEQTLKAPKRPKGVTAGAIEDEVRVVGGDDDPEPSPPIEVKASGATSTPADDTTEAATDDDAAAAGSDGGNVTPLRPRRDGDAQATG